MSNPTIHAFFVGRALAEALNEQVEETLTNAASELGKFDAEQRERLRQFSEEVLARAEREANQYAAPGSASATPNSSGDLQATIDELRASIASLRTELNAYNNQSVGS
jgi:vacuolar-type H+-ATPase subunit H